jgi:hypothetical protein
MLEAVLRLLLGGGRRDERSYSRFTKRCWQTPYTGRNVEDRGL